MGTDGSDSSDLSESVRVRGSHSNGILLSCLQVMHNVQLQMRQGDTGPTGISRRFAQLNSPTLSLVDPGLGKTVCMQLSEVWSE